MKRIFNPQSFTILLLILSFSYSKASVIKGKVTDENNTPLPYANIIILGTTEGTATNQNGEFVINTNKEKITLIFSYTGFNTLKKVVQTNRSEYLNIQLSPQAISIQEVVVKPGMEDPAYPIIRNAIKRRKFHLNQVKEYNCRSYTKGIVSLDKIPNKIMGKKLFKDSTERAEALGIQYLSESESDLYFKAPNTLQEKMISSRVSGDSQGFSMNYVSYFLMSFYKNRIEIPVDATQRGFISPIANGATFYYTYQLHGTFIENGKHINKIRVIPKRYIHPVFLGYIYIEDDTWRIHSVDLKIMPQVKLKFIDTVSVKQKYFEVINSVHMPFSQYLGFKFKINMMGIKVDGNGHFHSHFTNYKTNLDTLKPKLILKKNERLSVEKKSNKIQSDYFKKYRPIPLTQNELKNYHKKDSIETVHNSKEYKDSLKSKRNKFSFGDAIFGYRYYLNDSSSLYFTSPVMKTQFNTVQGYNSTIGLGYSKKLTDRKRFRLNSNLNYSFNNENIYGKVYAKYLYNADYSRSVKLSAGQYLQDINSTAPMSPLINSIYSLGLNENYMKLYKNSYVSVSQKGEIYNGFYLSSSLSFSNKEMMKNTTSESWSNSSTKYTPNNPYPGNVKDYKSLRFAAKLSYKHNQKYMMLPFRAVISGKYPTISVKYAKGISNIFDSDSDYDLVEFEIKQSKSLGFYGISNYSIIYGNYLNRKKTSIYDMKHFAGNETILYNDDLRSFQLLPIYKYSTNNNYLEAHFQHNFNGFILNKIPLIRNLKWQSFIKANYLDTKELNNYTEFGVGIKNTFSTITFFNSFIDGKYESSGFSIQLPLFNNVNTDENSVEITL